MKIYDTIVGNKKQQQKKTKKQYKLTFVSGINIQIIKITSM